LKSTASESQEEQNKMPKERKGRINKQNRVRPTGLPTLAEAQQAVIEDGDSDVIETGADVQPNMPIFQKVVATSLSPLLHMVAILSLHLFQSFFKQILLRFRF
jgi:hypothetical protein